MEYNSLNSHSTTTTTRHCRHGFRATFREESQGNFVLFTHNFLQQYEGYSLLYCVSHSTADFKCCVDNLTNGTKCAEEGERYISLDV